MSKLHEPSRLRSRLAGALAGLAIAVVSSAGLGTTARAAPIFFDMTLVGTFGLYNGTIGTGSFSIESSLFTGTGSEAFIPVGGSGSFVDIPGLLSFNFEFAGNSYSMADDSSYPNLPAVAFLNGVFDGYNFASITANELFSIGDYNFFHINPNQLETQGYVTTSLSVVPLPAALPLFLSGLAGLGLVGRRRRKHAVGAESYGVASSH